MVSRRARVVAAFAVALALVPVACGPDPQPRSVAAPVVVTTATPGPEVVAPKAPPGTPDVSVARRELAGLVREERPMPPGYSREQFGGRWVDLDGNACTTREDVLGDWLGIPLLGGMCDASGSILDPYVGNALIVPGEADLDHVVSLADAWRSGATGWTAQRRIAFYNDPRNLVPTRASVNRSKGDKGPERWLPPRREYRCSYALIYVGTKAEYGLSVTNGQAEVLRHTLDRCPLLP